MKPRRIILLRHGESVGNIDKTQFSHTANFLLGLTERGKKQARKAGQEIAELLADESLGAYYSPWVRAKQTFDIVHEVMPHQIRQTREDPRLREQDWGHYKELDFLNAENQARKDYGKFYFRLQDGESCADVYDRISTFLESLHRDFTKPDYPDNTLIVSHGVTILVFLMRWFHWAVQDFEDYRVPSTGQLVVLTRDDGRYRLATNMTRRSNDISKDVIEFAVRVFGDERKAELWLSTHITALNGNSPRSYLRSAQDAEDVLRILRRIEVGEVIS